jgi:ORF6N domain
MYGAGLRQHPRSGGGASKEPALRASPLHEGRESMAASIAQIESRMFLIRGQKVMLSHHLAELYEVETKVLNQAVKRNIERFPEDFMFQLNSEEFANLKSQFVISSWAEPAKPNKH